MSNPVEKMTIKNLADELGVSKNTVRNQRRCSLWE